MKIVHTIYQLSDYMLNHYSLTLVNSITMRLRVSTRRMFYFFELSDWVIRCSDTRFKYYRTGTLSCKRDIITMFDLELEVRIFHYILCFQNPRIENDTPDLLHSQISCNIKRIKTVRTDEYNFNKIIFEVNLSLG